MYLRTAKSLALEGQYGSAMVLLEDSGKSETDSVEARRIRAAAQKGMVPEFSGTEVDRRIMEELLEEVDSE